jgi:hypothetical protein
VENIANPERQTMTIFDQEKSFTFRAQIAWINAKDEEHRSDAETAWLSWAAKRIKELEATKS